MPPEGFDSVKGNTNGSDIYVIYANKKTYPEYLITYTAWKLSTIIYILSLRYFNI